MAEQVLADIKNRGLISGDRYLTAEEARSNFQVGKALMNDALRLLADREVLIRRRRAGTFIGPGFRLGQPLEGAGPAKQSALDVVHVLLPMGYYRANVMPGSIFVEELTRVIPGVSVQLHHIEDKVADRYTLELLSRVRAKAERREGLVLIRSSREVQLAVQRSGVPAVLFGSVYPNADKLYSVDPDQEQAGRLAAEAALARGHDRFALIMRNLWRRGDNLLMDGFSTVLGEAGVGVDRISIVSSPEDVKVIEHDVESLLSQDPHPTALICRSRLHAECALQGIQARGLEAGKDILVIATQPGRFDGLEGCVAIGPAVTRAQQVEKVAQMLLAIAQERAPEVRRDRIEMRAFAVSGE